MVVMWDLGFGVFGLGVLGFSFGYGYGFVLRFFMIILGSDMDDCGFDMVVS